MLAKKNKKSSKQKIGGADGVAPVKVMNALAERLKADGIGPVLLAKKKNSDDAKQREEEAKAPTQGRQKRKKAPAGEAEKI